MTIEEIVEQYPEAKEHIVFIDAFSKAKSVLKKSKVAVCSVSGGADSDVMLDILEKVKGPENEIHYVWFDTGLELDATKEHIDYLEDKYKITIDRMKPKYSVPYSVRHFGMPLVNKMVSTWIDMLQRNDFKYEDKPYPELVKEYPNAQSGMRWWSNYYHSEYDEKIKSDKWTPEDSQFNICRNRHLKEYLIQNPPDFKVNAKCCYYAKKKLAINAIKYYQADLDILGLRKAEGGRRSFTTKCYHPKDKNRKYNIYYPIFWFTDSEKKAYEEIFDVTHSKCYTEYGFKRTGCVGCPFSRELNKDLTIIQKYEPAKYKACQAVFGKAYEWQKGFKEYKENLKKQES